MTEYLININEAAQYFYKYPQPPKAGMIAPTEVPGIGNDIDETKIEKETKLR